ncbi:hypothetical protein EDC04DRAFT_974151 [Pisolithus marmoratus]|nr:hypothetical protein EDC04DRAFT_974151 [Pisolithus marmoratus]
MSLPGIRSFSRLPLRTTDDASSSSTPFSALGDINYVSSPLSDTPQWEANTNVRDTPPRGNPDVQAWVNKLCISPSAGGESNSAAHESQFRDNASYLNALPTSPLGEIAIDEDDIIIAVMGPTGAGKSTFVDRALGRPDVGASHDLISYTKEMRPYRYPHSDGIRNIVLVDTPGFDDTFMTDAQILRQIAHWLNATYKKNIKLSGVLYLHRISDNRVSGTPLRNYNMFKELCGKENFKNVILVTTMWDEVTEEVGSAREKELQSDFWGSMISLGSTIHRFDGTMESAWKIINSLSVAPPVQRRPLQIQREMVDKHMPLHRTAAGRAVMATLTGLISGAKEIFKRFGNGRQKSPSPIPQDIKHPRPRAPSSLSMRTVTTSSYTSYTSSNNRSVGSGVISLSSSGTCSTEGYKGNLVQVIPVLQAALGIAELVRIPHLRDVISPSLSIALSIETMTGMHHALFQVLQTATLLINAVAERARQTRLSADIRAAIKEFAKQMSDVQGIVQNVAQRQSEERQLLQSADARVISACANSMRLVCDVLRSAPSLRTSLRGVDDSLGALKRSLEIDSCNCGVPVPVRPASA